MEDWKLVQYNNVIDSFLNKHNIDLDSPDKDKQGNLERRLGTLLELGNECRPPISKPLGDGLFELIAQEDRKQLRLAYFFMRSPHHRTMCFVHAFIKKTNQTDPNDIKIAKKNKKLAEKEGSKIHGFNFAN